MDETVKQLNREKYIRTIPEKRGRIRLNRYLKLITKLLFNLYLHMTEEGTEGNIIWKISLQKAYKWTHIPTGI